MPTNNTHPECADHFVGAEDLKCHSCGYDAAFRSTVELLEERFPRGEQFVLTMPHPHFSNVLPTYEVVTILSYTIHNNVWVAGRYSNLRVSPDRLSPLCSVCLDPREEAEVHPVSGEVWCACCGSQYPR